LQERQVRTFSGPVPLREGENRKKFALQKARRPRKQGPYFLKYLKREKSEVGILIAVLKEQRGECAVTSNGQSERKGKEAPWKEITVEEGRGRRPPNI